MDLVEGERTGLLTRWIQHDALILPGNSGGPLVDRTGEVVGINELGGGGVGFAIPANVAAAVLAAARATGEVERGWLGFSVLPVQKAGLARGALVADVWPGSPARQAGLLAGDVLMAIDGTPVTARFFEEVPLVYQAIADLKPGRTARLDVERQGRSVTLQARVERMGRFLGDEEEAPQVGATVQEITAAMALFRRYQDTAGVLVTGVRPGFAFEDAKPALTAGDVLLAVGDVATPSLEALRGALRQQRSASYAVTFRRRHEVLVSVVTASREKPETAGTELPKAWLGVRTQVLTGELAQALHLGTARGLRVTEVLAHTRAQGAGLRAGDILTAIGDRRLTSSRPQDAHDLQRVMEELPVNQEVSVTLLRDGKPLTLSVVAEPEPKGTDLAGRALQADFEFTVREIVAADRMEDDQLPEGQGVLVSEVTEGGLASLAGLELNDVVLAVNDQPVDRVAGFNAVMKRTLAGHPRFVKIFLRRGYRTHFVFIEPERQPGAGR
jgi:serine protease Do